MCSSLDIDCCNCLFGIFVAFAALIVIVVVNLFTSRFRSSNSICPSVLELASSICLVCVGILCLHVGPPHDSKSRLISASRECTLCCSSLPLLVAVAVATVAFFAFYSCFCFGKLLWTWKFPTWQWQSLLPQPPSRRDPYTLPWLLCQPSLSMFWCHMCAFCFLFFCMHTPAPLLPYSCTLHIIVNMSPPLTGCLLIVAVVVFVAVVAEIAADL